MSKEITKKLKMLTELAYIVGIMTLSLGTAFATKADFGISMIAAPAYLTHILLTKVLSSFFTFGRCEIILEIIVVILMCIIIRRVKLLYLYSIVSGILYGIFLDIWIMFLKNIYVDSFTIRLIYFLLGQIFTAFGISFMFKSYLPQAAYDFFVKEVASYFNIKVPVFKTCFDITFLIISIILSFSIFGLGHFEGIKLGTIFIALVNGTTIGIATSIIDACFDFKDLFKVRKNFE